MRTTPLAACLAVVCLAVAAACHDSPDPTAPPTAGEAALRVVNAASGPIDVAVDGAVVLRGLAASSVSARVAVAVGSRTVELRRPGGGVSADVDLVARAGGLHTVTALSGAAGFSAAVLSDTGATPVPGAGKLRVVHLAAGAPDVDVWRTQPDHATPTRVMFPFSHGAKSGFLQSTPGTWEVWVTPAGRTEPVLATSGPVDVRDGWVRTVMLLDAPGGLKLQTLGDE